MLFCILKKKKKQSKKKGERERKEKANKSIDQLKFLYTLCLQNDLFYYFLFFSVLYCTLQYCVLPCLLLVSITHFVIRLTLFVGMLQLVYTHAHH